MAEVLGRALQALPDASWLGLDAALVIAGLNLAYGSLGQAAQATGRQVTLWQAALILVPLVVLCGLLHGLYHRQTLANRSWIVARTLLTAVLSGLGGYTLIHFLICDEWSRRIAVTTLASYAAMAITLRLGAAAVIRTVRPALLVVGRAYGAPQMKALVDDPAMRVYGAIHRLHDLVGEAHRDRCERIRELCQAYDIREVVIDPRDFGRPGALQAALDCLHEGRRVTDAVTFFEKTLHRVPVDAISPEWLLAADLGTHGQGRAVIWRFLDVLLAAAGLLITLVLAPFIALAIKLDSRGPVFYSQERVGMNGRPFRLHKFRTMSADAEFNGARWSVKPDSRITRVGRLLRRTRLDELPQLWNIFRGDMSVVGPRPERPEFVHRLRREIPFYEQRHLVKPGLTGWAQVNFRYGSCVQDARRKLEYDLYYIKHKSLELDLAILVRTFQAVMSFGS